MSQTPLTESQLHLAVEQLRTQHTNTIDLYKAVAALLFFQYDSTPTTNRMYQLVRKGSMSAPAEALRLFWQDLRDRSQVRMEQADIPTGLKQAVGALVSQLWEESVLQAEQLTDQSNQAIYVRLAQAEQNYADSLLALKTQQSALSESQAQLDQYKQDLEALIGQKTVLQQQTDALHSEKQKQQVDYEQRLQQLKEQGLLSEQRATDMEKYARLEIERVRQEATKAQQQDQARLAHYQQQQQTWQQDYNELQKTHLTLQQKHVFQTEKLSQHAMQTEQLESKNQDLHALLQQLQTELALSRKTEQKRRQSPSRLAVQKKTTINGGE